MGRIIDSSNISDWNRFNFILINHLDSLIQVDECVANGAKVVNLSLGGPGYSRFEKEAYERMYKEQDILLVAAAGNAGTTAYSYPASLDSVISVAAVDTNNNHASFSQVNDMVDVCARGVLVSSTISGNRYVSS